MIHVNVIQTIFSMEVLQYVLQVNYEKIPIYDETSIITCIVTQLIIIN